jgi:hypothetical protein
MSFMSGESYSMMATQARQVSMHTKHVFSHSGQSHPMMHSRQARRQSLQALMHLSFAEASSAAVATGERNVRLTARATSGKRRRSTALVSGGY